MSASLIGRQGQALSFLLLTAARRTEVADMRWSELSNGNWTIPKERSKTNTETTLPLSVAAKRVLDELPRIEGCDYVFTTNASAPISGFSVLKLRFDIACGVKNWRLHDLRRTARSLLSRAGVNPDIAERCLGHAIGGSRGVYDRHPYIEEMRHARPPETPPIAVAAPPQSGLFLPRSWDRSITRRGSGSAAFPAPPS